MRNRERADGTGRYFDPDPKVGCQPILHQHHPATGTWHAFPGGTHYVPLVSEENEPMNKLLNASPRASFSAERMSDIHTKWKKKDRYKPVDHSKLSYSCMPVGASYWNFSQASGMYFVNPYWTVDELKYTYDHHDLAANHTVKRIISEEAWCEEEFDDVSQALAIGHSIVEPRAEDASGGWQAATAVAELINENRHGFAASVLARNLKEWKRVLTQMVRFRHLGENLDDLLVNVGKFAADARLTWSFALSPLYSDLENALNMFYDLDTYVRAWNLDARYGTVRLRHVDISQYIPGYLPAEKTTLRETEFSANFAKDGLTIHGGTPLTISATVNERLTRSARAVYSFGFKPEKIDDNSRQWGRDYNRAAMRFDSLGLGDPLNVAWNLIPFSFLLDYVLSVDEFLDQFGADLYQMPYQNVHAGYSLKRTSEIELSSAMRYSGVNASNYCSGKGSVRTYRRIALDGTGEAPIRSDQDIQWERLQLEKVNKGQVANVLALITTLLSEYF